MRVGDANLGIGRPALLAADLERDDPGGVGLERQGLHVEHQPRMLVVADRDAGRRLDHRQLAPLRLGVLDAPLDLAHRLQVLVELRAVAASEAALQAVDLIQHRVENAALPPQPRRPHLGVGAVDVPEEPVEHHARVGLHRQRRRRAAPREPVLVGAAETDVAGADAVDGVRPLQAELQRGQRRLLAHRVRQNLIHRDAQLQAGAAGGRQRLDAGQEGAGRLGMGAGGARAGSRPRVVEPAHQQQMVAIRLERLQGRRELEAPPVGEGRPPLHDDAVRHVDGAEPEGGLRRGLRERGRGRHHAVQQRQRQSGADAPQNRPARNGLLRNDHDSALRIRKGVLLTIPETSDDQVISSAAASRLICRTTGMS